MSRIMAPVDPGVAPTLMPANRPAPGAQTRQTLLVGCTGWTWCQVTPAARWRNAIMMRFCRAAGPVGPPVSWANTRLRRNDRGEGTTLKELEAATGQKTGGGSAGADVGPYPDGEPRAITRLALFDGAGRITAVSSWRSERVRTRRDQRSGRLRTPRPITSGSPPRNAVM